MKEIVNYPNYRISENGNVYTLNNKIKVYSLNNKGYKRITLSNQGIKKSFSIHRLVALHFIPNPLNLPQVNHLDGNKLNNHVSNLEWCTNKQNIRHAIDNNLADYAQNVRKRYNKFL